MAPRGQNITTPLLPHPPKSLTTVPVTPLKSARSQNQNSYQLSPRRSPRLAHKNSELTASNQQFRPSGRSNRSGRSQADHDIFEGLPVRQWQQSETVVGLPPPTEVSQGGDNAWPELPMPRDSSQLATWTQQLLREARRPRLAKRPQEPAEDEKRDEEEDNENVQTGWTNKKWTQLPNHLERPEREYLAKRRKGLPSLHAQLALQAATAIASTAPTRKTRIAKLDADGNTTVYEVLVPEGQTIEGEVVEDTIMADAEPVHAAPGTVIEGVGIANAEGLIVATDLLQQQQQPVRRKPIPPRRVRKGGPGRGKKKVMFTPGQDPSGAASTPGGGPVANTPTVKDTNDDTSVMDVGSTPKNDAHDEGDDDEGDDGEEGDDDDDREDGEVSEGESHPAPSSRPTTSASEPQREQEGPERMDIQTEEAPHEQPKPEEPQQSEIRPENPPQEEPEQGEARSGELPPEPKQAELQQDNHKQGPPPGELQPEVIQAVEPQGEANQAAKPKGEENQAEPIQAERTQPEQTQEREPQAEPAQGEKTQLEQTQEREPQAEHAEGEETQAEQAQTQQIQAQELSEPQQNVSVPDETRLGPLAEAPTTETAPEPSEALVSEENPEEASDSRMDIDPSAPSEIQDLPQPSEDQQPEPVTEEPARGAAQTTSGEVEEAMPEEVKTADSVDMVAEPEKAPEEPAEIES